MFIIVSGRMAIMARLRTIWPVLVAFGVATAFALWRMSAGGWDPMVLAELGTRYAQGDPDGSEGYDGQFSYYIAVDPNPYSVKEHLDVPAYRYQRILYPILARSLVGGEVNGIPWALLAVNLVAHAIGTWVVVLLLNEGQLWGGYGLIYGLWVGLIAGIGLQMHEPLAYALIAVGWLLRRRGRRGLGAIFLGLALFSKETSLPFWGAALLADLLDKDNRGSVIGLAASGLAFAGWQVWLWSVFGSPGLGSGGAMATSFEWIPFMGLWRIGQVSMTVLGLFVVIFGPTVVLPAIWGVIAGWQTIRQSWRQAEPWALLFNGLLIVFLPFSTFREPLGLLRFSTGLVLSVIFFAVSRGQKKILNYGLFWIPLLVILVNG